MQSRLAASQYLTPHFTRAEMSCRHCGRGYHWPQFMDALEAMRLDVGRPMQVLSGHRCALHNARVGGAPRSEHLKLAADIALRGHNPAALAAAAKRAGFTGFGYYSTFLHIDMGGPRSWHGTQRAKQLWQTF